MTILSRSKRWGLLTLAILLSFALTLPAAEAATKKKSTANPRYGAIVVDADTGVILHESNADKALHPASLVKMMTLIMAFDRLANGSMTLNQRIRISSHAASQPPSKLGLRPGSTITVKDAIYALVTKSANDIAVAMGEHIGGTESQFAAMMTQRAKELGMTRTRFKNASGLHHPDQVSSARDMAILSRTLIKSYPQQYKYFSTKNFSFNGASHRNHNRLMESYKGMDGIKTGYIGPSGFNLAASAVRGNHRLIAVVFGGRTTASRNAAVAKLLDNGFAKLGATSKDVLVANARANIPVPERKPNFNNGETTALAMNDTAQNTALMTGTMGELAGEGDIDPAIARRFETGMMAIAAIKGGVKPAAGPTAAIEPATPGTAIQNAAFHQGGSTTIGKTVNSNDWSIQVGAFTSRVRSDQALNEALGRLPGSLRSNARPVIVPLKAGDGWVFRARIRGLSRDQAAAACKYFNNCMAISPRAF
ncbi:MAG: D-alanyl-D-alanine carboxypeptidase family protein [Micavibrio sp.]